VALASFSALCRLRDDIDRDHAEQLLTDLPDGIHSPFAASVRTHFARLQIISEIRIRARRPLEPPLLLWSCDVDDDAYSYLVELLTVALDPLARVLALCADAPDDPTRADFPVRAADYLVARRIRIGLQYVHSPGRSASEIRDAVIRRRRLAGFALAHQDDTPAVRRMAFLDAFATTDALERER
jgi:hypothetical protein